MSWKRYAFKNFFEHYSNELSRERIGVVLKNICITIQIVSNALQAKYLALQNNHFVRFIYETYTEYSF